MIGSLTATTAANNNVQSDNSILSTIVTDVLDEFFLPKNDEVQVDDEKDLLQEIEDFLNEPYEEEVKEEPFLARLFAELLTGLFLSIIKSKE